MFRGLLGLLVAASPAVAADPLRFRFEPGQTLTYNVSQTTTVRETTADDKTPASTTTKLTLTRRWTVTAVEPNGTATLEMAITATRQEITRPGPPDQAGKPTADTTVLDSATDDGKKAMAEYLGKPIVTVKLDAQGRLLEAKGAAGAAARLEAEPPFRLTLPDAAPAAGATWDRAFAVKLDPPHGTGEKYDAAQTYTYKGPSQGYAVVGLATALKSPPTDPAELAPLVPLLWEGDVYFHPETGRYAGARLKVKKAVDNHQGAGSKFEYESEYAEGLAAK